MACCRVLVAAVAHSMMEYGLPVAVNVIGVHVLIIRVGMFSISRANCSVRAYIILTDNIIFP